MRTFLRLVFFTAVVLGGTALLGLFVMSGLARADGVKQVPIPSDSYITSHVRAADYADSYRVGMEFDPYGSIDDVIDNAFEKGSGAIYRTDKEVCYEGVAPGLTYRISYIHDRDISPHTLTVSTTVHYVDAKGKWYFMLALPIHKMLVPYMVDRMSKVSIDR